MNDTRFVREIRMQPSALRTVADFYSSEEGATLLSKSSETISAKRRLVFTGMGTSLYSPYLIYKELAGVSPVCEIQDASELLHFGLQGFQEDEILVAVSQSGESAETKQVVERLAGKVPVISIVNDHSSVIARKADIFLPILAGREASISTKTYTNTLSVLLMLSTYIKRGNPDVFLRLLHDTADIMEQNLEEIHSAAKQAVSFFGTFKNLHMVARGSDLVTARQWALIIKEGAGVFSEALSAGLFRHGPIELAGEGHTVIYMQSRGNEPELTMNLAKETGKMGSSVLVVSDRKAEDNSSSSNIMHIHIKCPCARVFPLMCAPFIEYFVHETAQSRGKEAGIFRHATKITSSE